MAVEEKIAAWLEDPEARARGLRWGWWISLAFLVFGYGLIVYKLFF